jgi:hypothetical protein
MHPVILEKIWYWLIQKLPRILVSRFVKVERIANEFEIDLASPTHVSLFLNTFVPHFEIYLRVSNKSALPVTIDRILLDVWVGQPLLDAAGLHRKTLLPKETEPKLYGRWMLNELQRQAAKSQLSDKGQLKTDMTVNITVYCDCKLGPFKTARRVVVRSETVPVSG